MSEVSGYGTGNFTPESAGIIADKLNEIADRIRNDPSFLIEFEWQESEGSKEISITYK
ncbi:TPA: hypothetical protein JG901_001740 [Enterobacter hormaechei subsp. steigerwaltii]|uniref:hypothetical protein n=1 Tax=Enterobacter TaxID=547 RepID=UPI001BE0584C|nr:MULTISPECIES: hypothetical protein [Enterobacter]HAV1677770.1 hypothetical protein [Enterobacter hormaechei subsp. steigerwaltii]ELC6491080.1 hypothetical protein [Enterobacter hormaechei]ELC6551200.1 hypothetical protein [Enterobacter hormaechei]ELD7982710.1 hypothetical protein [Enterobacter hormaechei]MBT1794950.1 hypothetical protein [Enterobacter hormaechei subsp. xiangfangensis]